jgi:site-specific DNA-methyltransferase (adenine-specific)
MSRPPFADSDWELLEGDALGLLRQLPERSVDAVVTDPPYGIDLLGTAWDGRMIRAAAPDDSPARAYVSWSQEWTAECRRVLKPGGYLLAFGAPRTVHRLALAFEQAGLELRDQLLWLYGSGLPKSSLRAGRASALKPAYEPILVGRTPLQGTLEESERRWGTGRLGIDDARIASSAERRGRWPCNIVLAHASRCSPTACRPTCPAGMLDMTRPGSRPSRFFYCPKPARSERDAGCDALPARVMKIYGRGGKLPRHNTHPTVKPVALMRWLVRLACPPHGLVLDPFAGSGSTGLAALEEQRRFLGIERDRAYARIALARLAHATRACARDGGTAGGTESGSARRTAIQPSERRPEP